MFYFLGMKLMSMMASIIQLGVTSAHGPPQRVSQTSFGSSPTSPQPLPLPDSSKPTEWYNGYVGVELE